MRRQHQAVIGAAVVLAFTAAVASAGTRRSEQSRPEEPGDSLVTLRTDSPVVAIRLMFRAGSIHDPAGKEGLTALTGLMMAQAGTAKRSYAELIDALYPMAAGIGVTTDREVTVISGTVHREKLGEYMTLLEEALLQPGFQQADFERNREQLLAYLTSTLRAASDELLGLEMIQQKIFEGHPYEHSPAGTVSGLGSITLDDVKAAYRERFLTAQPIVGVAGGYSDDLVPRLRKLMTRFGGGPPRVAPLPAPPSIAGRRITLIDKQADSVGLHFGYPLSITRADADFYPLLVANSFLGEHRTFHGRLMQQLRGLRGLNYGDYSYIEFWDDPPGTSNPAPNVPRRQQYFSVWVRPVVPTHAPFALRNAIWEVDRLIEQGMTSSDFTLTRDFLVSYSKLWARSLTDRLGFHMDSRFYGMPYFIDEIERRLGTLTLEEVNAAIRKYLQTRNLQIVAVTGGAAELKKTLETDAPTPITYGNPVPPEVTKADQTIQALPVKPAAVTILPVGRAFEGRATTSSKKP
jgi:zinc protease